MNGRSRWSSCGATRNRCTNAGNAAPAMIETSASSPTAITGSAHPRSRMFTRNRTAHAIAMNARIRSAGSWAFTSVYEAPTTTPRVEVSRSNCPR